MDNTLRKTDLEYGKTIAIIGAGASGTLTAYHLVKTCVAARIVVIDPAAGFGPGLAYGTPSARHLLNVPAGKISALASEPDHFLRWLQQNSDSTATTGTFAPRAVYGRYLQELFSEAKAVELVHTAAVGMARDGDGYTITLGNGEVLHADYVVLATGNFAPQPCPGVDLLSVHSPACHNPWLPAAYENLRAEDTVTLIGTGLTAVDVLLRLREQGFAGTVLAVSRHGRLPNRHAAYTPAASSAIPLTTTPTCISYLRAFRAATRSGVAWRAAVDSLRATTNDLWLALPIAEQRRFRRHLQGHWNVARHRMAASIADVIYAELTAGTLLLRKGRVDSVETSQHDTRVTNHGNDGKFTFVASRIINCTGSDTNYRRVNSPLFASLFDRGLVSAGPLADSFHTSISGSLIDAAGNVSETLFSVGPGRLGTLMESNAMPEIARQALEVAEEIAKHQQAATASEQAA